MNKWKINSLQLASFIIFIIVFPISGISFLNLIKSSSVDCYISVIIAFILGFIPLFIVFYISNYNHDYNINDVINEIFGKTIGFIIKMTLSIIILIITFITAFSINNLVISQFLSQTPLIVISITFGLIVTYNMSKGFQNMSRISLTFLMINFFLLIITIIGLIPTTNLDNIKPILENGFKNPIIGALSFLSTNILPIFVILIIPRNNLTDKKNYSKYLLLFYIFSMLVSFAVIFLTIDNLGIYLCRLFQYPEYVVLKRISFLNFIDRIENVISIQWILSSIVSFSIMIYYISKTIKDNKKNDKTNIYITIMISFIILILALTVFKNNTLFNNFCYHIYPYITGLLFIFYIIIFIGVFLKKRKKKIDKKR